MPQRFKPGDLMKLKPEYTKYDGVSIADIGNARFCTMRSTDLMTYVRRDVHHKSWGGTAYTVKEDVVLHKGQLIRISVGVLQRVKDE